jgi:hypothetical protein
VKVLIAFLGAIFILAAFPRFDVLRRRPIWLVGISCVVAASYTSLRVIGV